MKNRAAKIMTLILLVLSLMLTASMTFFAIDAIFVLQAVPPIVVMFLCTLFLVWMDVFYVKSYVWLKSPTADPKVIHKLTTQNIILMAFMGSTSLSMWTALFGSIVILQLFGNFQWNVLGVALVSGAYTANGILLQVAFLRAQIAAKQAALQEQSPTQED